MAKGQVQTVLGPVDAVELGHTQMHEHLLSDQSRFAAPPGETGDGGPWHARAIDQDAIRPRDYQWIRRYQRHHRGNLVLDDVELAIAELADYRRLGGGAIVDATSIGIGRDPTGLAAIARGTGLHVVMGSGFYVEAAHPPELASLSVDELASRIVDDATVGVDGTGIRAGIIGELGLSWPLGPGEERVLRAAALAQQETGLAIQIHPGRDAEALFDAVERVASYGGRADRTIVAHVVRSLFGLTEMVRLAETGCYLELDLFGYESSYYPFGPIDMPNDATRIDYLLGLRDAGYLDRLLVSCDIAQKTRLKAYGGEGYEHILENVIPLMLRKGLSPDDVHAITVGNPAAVLTAA